MSAALVTDAGRAPPPTYPSLDRSLARSYLPCISAPARSPRVWPSGRPAVGWAVLTRPRSLGEPWPRSGGVVTSRSRRKIARHAPPPSLAYRISCRLVARAERRERPRADERREDGEGGLCWGAALRSAGEAGRGSAFVAEHAAGTARERWLRLRGVNSKIKPQFDARRAATRREREAERPSAPLTRCSSTRSCAAEELDAGHTLRHGYFE